MTDLQVYNIFKICILSGRFLTAYPSICISKVGGRGIRSISPNIFELADKALRWTLNCVDSACSPIFTSSDQGSCVLFLSGFRMLSFKHGWCICVHVKLQARFSACMPKSSTGSDVSFRCLRRHEGGQRRIWNNR